MSKRSFYSGLVYFFGALASILFGYDTGVMSYAITFIKKDAALSTVTLSSAAQGLIVSGVMWGAIPGAILGGPLGDRFGRRRTTIAMGMLFTIGGLGCAFAPSVPILVICRVLLGLAVGGASALVPVYLSEMAPARMRGSIGGLNVAMWNFGILLAYVVDSFYSSAGDWRMMLGLSIVPAIALMVGMFFMPESPRWLLQNKGKDSSLKVLQMTRDADEAEQELAEIVQLKKAEASEEAAFSSFSHALKEPWIRQVFIVGIVLSILQQILGAQVLQFYTPTILEATGFSQQFVVTTLLGIGIMEFVFVFLGMALVDRIGRKSLLIAGNVICFVTIGLLGVSGLLGSKSGILMLICMCVFMASFAATWGMTLWIITSEITPFRIRGFAMGAYSMLLWLASALVAQFFPILGGVFGYSPMFVFFAIVNLFAAWYVARMVPETKGLSLELIEMNLRARYDKRHATAKEEAVPADAPADVR